MKRRILQIGNPKSPLNYGIGLAAQSERNQIYWYSHIEGDLPGVVHYSMPQWIGRSYLLRALLEPFFVAYYICKVKPHLTQVHYASKGLATIPIVRQRPLIVTTMGSDIVAGLGYKFPYRFWIDLMLRRADKVTTRSGFMKQRLIEMGVEAAKIEVNSWGIDLEHFCRHEPQAELKQKWGLPSDAFVFFDPRSTNPLYNKDIIFRAFAEVSQQSKQKVRLLVAAMFATEEEMEQLRALAQELGITDKVHFLGSVEYLEMPELYGLAEVTVSVPSSDGMPQTIFEAWACGSFLIVGDLPQYNEFIEDGVTAKRVAIRDVDALAEAMLWIMENSQIREQAIELGRDRASHFADREVQKAHMRDLVESMMADNTSDAEGE